MNGKRNLKVGYWNIRGLKQSDGSFKTALSELRERILMYDMFCISEIQCSELEVPGIDGYNCFTLCRGLNVKSNRCYGGLCIYYKEHLRKGIKFLAHRNVDYVWIKLDRHYFGMGKDVFMCVTYIPPEYSTFYKSRGDDTMQYIEEDVAKYISEGSVIILGDLNARTNIANDYIENDTDVLDDNNLYDLDSMCLKRNSQDKITMCPRGK
jgi:hypothetical protein